MHSKAEENSHGIKGMFALIQKTFSNVLMVGFAYPVRV